ncbi:MAG: hypothetical protein WKF86_00130 [Acidimicrobiales bacterium]
MTSTFLRDFYPDEDCFDFHQPCGWCGVALATDANHCFHCGAPREGVAKVTRPKGRPSEHHCIEITTVGSGEPSYVCGMDCGMDCPR